MPNVAQCEEIIPYSQKIHFSGKQVAILFVPRHFQVSK